MLKKRNWNKKSREKIILRIERDPGYNKRIEDIILHEARKRLGKKINIEFDYVSDIKKDKNGKFKFIIQNLDVKQELQ